ncbi:MAG: prephenate dehydrogenase [Parasporobacterium sp.]|nr:prephenate dehydrogenase [Parasporobacterium sp.]
MTFNKDTKILIVGLGHLGGSYAQALTAAGFEVGAIDTDPEVIAFALGKGWIAHGKTENDPEYISGFDMIISALYPKVFIAWAKENVDFIKEGALVTDTTGVKASVIAPVQEILGDKAEFIAAHPMAGKETSGVYTSTPEIFEEANYIVVATEKNTQAAIDACVELGRILGFARISFLGPDEHDEIIGFLSQLCHCIAVSLMLCSDSDKLVDYTGDSFRGLTRIAKINDRMWSELFDMNKEKLVAQIDLFSANLQKVRDSIENSDTATLRGYMQTATERRKKFDTRK